MKSVYSIVATSAKAYTKVHQYRPSCESKGKVRKEGRERKRSKPYLELCAVLVAHGDFRCVFSSSSVLDLLAVLVGSRSKVHGSGRVSETSVPGEEVGEEHGVQVADMRG
jgi:hypothetical protein